MKVFKSLCLPILFFVFLFSACSEDLLFQKEDALTNIPAEVSMVTSMNIAQLMEKADFESVKKMEFYQKMISEAEKENAAFAEVLRDPDKSGIDLKKNLYITCQLDSNNPEEVFVATVFSLNNADKFGELVKNVDAGSIQNNDGYQQAGRKGQAIIAWNNKIGVIGGSSSEYLNSDEKIQQIFQTKKENSVANDLDLQKALNGKHDITAWLSSNALANNPNSGLALSMLDLDSDALKNNFIHNQLDFEKGEIVGHSDFYMSKGLGDQFIGRFFKEGVATDFSSYLPAENLAFATVAAIDFKGIDQFLSERPQAKGYLDFVLKEFGFKMKDVIAVFGGDVLVAGFSKEKLDNSSVLFATNIKDRKKLDEFLDGAVEKNLISELGNGFYKIKTLGYGDGFSITRGSGFGKMLVTKDMLFASANGELLKKIKDGGFKKSDRAKKEILNVLKKSTLASYFDFEVIKNAIRGLEEINFTQLEFTVKGSQADAKMKLKDMSKNSLKAIFEMLNETYLKENKKEI